MKKNYQKPTMKVVQLQQQTHLMAGSGVQSMRSDYGEANPGVDPNSIVSGEWIWE